MILLRLWGRTENEIFECASGAVLEDEVDVVVIGLGVVDAHEVGQILAKLVESV